MVKGDERQAGWRRTDGETVAVLVFCAASVLGLVVMAGLIVFDPPHHAAPDDTAAPAGTVAPTTTLDPRPEVAKAYGAFQTMAHRLYRAPDPTDPEIALRATGSERHVFEATLAKYKATGTVVKTGPQDHDTVLRNTVTGETATLLVCSVGQSGAYDAATGAVTQPMVIITEPFAVTLELEGRAWKVSKVRSAGQPVQGVWNCAQ